ncbi:MAG: SIR2 family protein [Gemmatimonadota bacterium]|nr:SIR2 family protein [Gemmatimonadota bacterium]MDE2865970.1 SIR2 family protein [Gemmatimonadota bacterium]
MVRDEIPDLLHEPSRLHVDLLSLPWSDVLTTNYDTLLERACRFVVSQRYDIVVNPADLERSRRPRIIKLHGSLPIDRPFVVTDEDYRRYPLDFAPFVNTVRQALLEKTLCLVGFSGDDPNFLQWIGWIRDNLAPHASRKMYMIGVFSSSHSQRMLLEQRNIIPIDMSECPGVDQDHYAGLDRFVAYLRSRRNEEDPLAWPSGESSPSPTDDEESVRTVVTAWRSTRAQYPGWVVVPEDRRQKLWRDTKSWIEREQLPDDGALRGPLDVEFAFELTWRTAKCLVPIFDNHARFVEAIVARYWPVTQSSGALPPLVDEAMMASRGLTAPKVARMCHYLLLSMMRYYREEGLSEKWLAASKKIETIKHTLSSEAEARFHYERTLFSMFSLDLNEVKDRLQEWSENDAHPFWSAKKAALMAEIGLLDEAERVLALSLEAIRTKSNLTPTHRDYTLASQESFVMFLLHAARHRSCFDNEYPSEDRDRRREFSGRWHALRQYKCDPWHELEVFRNKLGAMLTTEDVATFDIGRITRTHRLGGYDTERMTAYNFLRFCEDSGVPFRFGGVVIGTSTATGTLPRIASHSSHWALATLVRIGEPKAVDEVYDRSSLARLDAATVDSLIDVYLRAVRRARPDIESGAYFDDRGFGDRLAWVVPEILSRLCCKCSLRAKEKLVGFLLEVYQSERRVNYKGIRNLTQRLLQALTVQEQTAMIPKLLRFPILDDLDHLEQLEFVNPFSFVRIPEKRPEDNAMIEREIVEALLDVAASESVSGRRWAVATLGQMHDLGLLTDSQVVNYGRALWSRTGEDGFPTETDYTDYARYAFLRFPHPADVDPEAAFMEYVRRAEFPAQRETGTSVGGGGRRVVLCEEIQASGEVPWTPDDVRSIANRLIAWWDADRSHLRRAASREKLQDIGGWPSISRALRRQVRQLVRTLAVVVTRWPEPVDNDEIRDALRRVVEEMSEDRIPTLALRLACGRLFSEWWERALQEIENQDASTSEEDVVDAFVAILVASERGRGDAWLAEDDDIVERFMAVVADAIRWLSAEGLFHALQTMKQLVEKHPWAFVGECERAVLKRLDGLIRDTTVGGGHAERQGQDAARREASETSKEIAILLMIRRECAALAHRLLELYRARGTSIPEAIRKWKRICRSQEEFAEIRREWIEFE